jgi:membrane-bound lytic murein transglycosylase B
MRRYVTRMACDERVRIGLEKLAEHESAVARIAAEFGVPWQLLMAIWGVETNYGLFMGEHDVVTVLAQEAFQTRGTAHGDYIRR